MAKSKKLFIGLILILILTGCHTGRIDSLSRNRDESIIIARLRIVNDDRDITSKARLIFDNIKGYGVLPDDSCYIYFKLQGGKHYLSRIEYLDRSINLPVTLLSFKTPPSNIYYLGDISIKLDLDFNYSSMIRGIGGFGGALLGAAASVAYENRSVESPPILLENKIEDAKKYFNSLFSSNEPISQCKFICDTTNIFRDTSDVNKIEGPNKKELRRKHIK